MSITYNLHAVNGLADLLNSGPYFSLDVSGGAYQIVIGYTKIGRELTVSNFGSDDSIIAQDQKSIAMMGGLNSTQVICNSLMGGPTTIVLTGLSSDFYGVAFDQAGLSSFNNLSVGDITIAPLTSVNIPGFGNDSIIGTSGNDVLKGLAGNDTLDGGAGNDTLDGGVGADTMTGGLGDDIYLVDNTSDAVIESAAAGTDTVKASISYSLGVDVENLILTGVALINAIGNAVANVLRGNAAANVLDGGLGSDTLIGGLGNDTYVVDSAADFVLGIIGDTVTELAGLGSGIDKINTSLASYTLGANVENLAYTGTTAFAGTGNALANNIIGGIGNDTLNGGAGVDKLTGGDGNDTLDGGAGADVMIGGLGDDTYVVGNAANLALGILGDTVTELAGAGTDTVQSSVNYTLGLNLENLTLSGSSNLAGIGNNGNNILTGNTGINTLNGGSGNDTLDGGAGDTLLGGAGDDTLIYHGMESKINGGAGIDTLKISGANVTLDMSLLTVGKITGIEKLDLTGSGNNNLTVNLTNLLNLTGPVGHDLYVTGDTGDSVSIATLTGAMWTDIGAANLTTVGGVNYHQYTHTTGAVTDHLYVQDTLAQTLV